jgi:hypothetical protein
MSSTVRRPAVVVAAEATMIAAIASTALAAAAAVFAYSSLGSYTGSENGFLSPPPMSSSICVLALAVPLVLWQIVAVILFHQGVAGAVTHAGWAAGIGLLCCSTLGCTYSVSVGSKLSTVPWPFSVVVGLTVLNEALLVAVVWLVNQPAVRAYASRLRSSRMVS